MIKKVLLTLWVLLSVFIPVNAGELEDALGKGKDVFLYLYSPECKYCVMFSPKYEQLKKTYASKYTFVKANTQTPYGARLYYKYQAHYIPFVVMINSKQDRVLRISPNCLIDSVCADIELKKWNENK